MREISNKKSKLLDLLLHKTTKNIEMRPKYMSKQTRTECASIFKMKARMLKTKNNYKNRYQEMNCRWCNHQTETQEHILTECPEFKTITNNTEYQTYMQDNSNYTKNIAHIISKTMTKLEEKW